MRMLTSRVEPSEAESSAEHCFVCVCVSECAHTACAIGSDVGSAATSQKLLAAIFVVVAAVAVVIIIILFDGALCCRCRRCCCCCCCAKSANHMQFYTALLPLLLLLLFRFFLSAFFSHMSLHINFRCTFVLFARVFFSPLLLFSFCACICNKEEHINFDFWLLLHPAGGMTGAQPRRGSQQKSRRHAK